MENQVKKAVEEGVTKNKSSNSKEYDKYRWFYTSSRKLVIGGKNAEQNEEIIQELINSDKNYIVMHTKAPGSPFAIIQTESPKEKDLEETAIWTGSFSRGWREGKNKIIVDIFNTNQISKPKGMKIGSFKVEGEIKHKTIEPKLYLTTQKGKIRAVPQEKARAIIIVPGNISKKQIAEEISVKLEKSTEEILNAIPTGNSKIIS
jgi:predicted ribosome quality control (RQC) complex YloA/Tae2 family protein